MTAEGKWSCFHPLSFDNATKPRGLQELELWGLGEIILFLLHFVPFSSLAASFHITAAPRVGCWLPWTTWNTGSSTSGKGKNISVSFKIPLFLMSSLSGNGELFIITFWEVHQGSRRFIPGYFTLAEVTLDQGLIVERILSPGQTANFVFGEPLHTLGMGHKHRGHSCHRTG